MFSGVELLDENSSKNRFEHGIQQGVCFHAFKSAPRRATMRPRRAQDATQTTQYGAQDAPRCTQKALRCAHDALRCAEDAPRRIRKSNSNGVKLQSNPFSFGRASAASERAQRTKRAKRSGSCKYFKAAPDSFEF